MTIKIKSPLDDSLPKPISLPTGLTASHFDGDLRKTHTPKTQSKRFQDGLQPDKHPQPARLTTKGKSAKHLDPDMGPMENTGRHLPVIAKVDEEANPDAIVADAVIGGNGGTEETKSNDTRGYAQQAANQNRIHLYGGRPNDGDGSRQPAVVTPPTDDSDDAMDVMEGGGDAMEVKPPKKQFIFTSGDDGSSTERVRKPERMPRQARDSTPKEYKVFGIRESGATLDKIVKTYRKLSLKHHPDKGGDPEKMKEINEAYEQLKERHIKNEHRIRSNYKYLLDTYLKDSSAVLDAPTAQVLGINTGLKGTFKSGMSVFDAIDIMNEVFGYSRTTGVKSKVTNSVIDKISEHEIPTKKQRIAAQKPRPKTRYQSSEVGGGGGMKRRG